MNRLKNVLCNWVPIARETAGAMSIKTKRKAAPLIEILLAEFQNINAHIVCTRHISISKTQNPHQLATVREIHPAQKNSTSTELYAVFHPDFVPSFWTVHVEPLYTVFAGLMMLNRLMLVEFL